MDPPKWGCILDVLNGVKRQRKNPWSYILELTSYDYFQNPGVQGNSDCTCDYISWSEGEDQLELTTSLMKKSNPELSRCCSREYNRTMHASYDREHPYNC